MATLDDVRKLQKRARDKEYRLRKQSYDLGYTDSMAHTLDANIREASPRKDWAEVKSMNKRELNSYARKLDKFNTKTRLTGSESGDIIPTKYLDQAKRYAKAHNKLVDKAEKRLKNLAPDLYKEYVTKQQGILKNEGIGGVMTKIDPKKMTKPRSLAVAKRRVENFKKRSRRDFDYYRRIQRKNMMKQLNTLGEYELSELVRSMNNRQFDVLSSVLPTWEHLEIEYYDPTQTVHESARGNIRSYVYQAWGTGLKGDQADINARLDKTRAKRDAVGRKRAQAAIARDRAKRATARL